MPVSDSVSPLRNLKELVLYNYLSNYDLFRIVPLIDAVPALQKLHLTVSILYICLCIVLVSEKDMYL